MGRFFIVFLVLAGLTAPVKAQGYRDGLTLDGGWQEAVISVPDLDRAIAFYRTVAGWTLAHRGPIDEAWLTAWGLPADVTAQEAVVHNPGDATGFVRLMHFEGTAQVVARSAARAWEPGGHGGINMRVLDIAPIHAEMQRWGWHGFSDPVRFDLDRFTVTEVMMTGFGGEKIALIERSNPPLTGWPTLRKMSRTFNAWAVTDDFEAMMDFYLKVLGFEVFLSEEGPTAVPGMNLFGLPHNYVNQTTRQLKWVHPQGQNEGSLAVMAFYGPEGRSFKGRSVPPNFGLLSLRYPVSDALARYDQIADEADVTVQPQAFFMQPYGQVAAFTVTDPNGGWVTFFEPIDP